MSDKYSGAVMVHHMGDAYIVEFVQSSVLDQKTIDGFQADLEHIINLGGQPKIIISFGGVKNVTSSILGVLISTHKKCEQFEGELRLAAVSKNIMGVLKLMRIDKMLKVYPTTDKAIENF